MGGIRAHIVRLLTVVAALGLAGIPSWAQPARGNLASPAGHVTSRDLVEVRGLSGLMVSPDGAFAALRVERQNVASNTTVLTWVVIRLHDGQIMRTADAGAVRWNNNGYIAIETPQWSADGAWIYFRKLVGEEVQLWRIPRTGTREEQVTRDASDVQTFLIASHGQVHYAVGPATRHAIKQAEAEQQANGVLLDGSIIKGFPVIASFPVNGRKAAWRRIPGGAGRGTLLGATPLHAFTLDKDGRARPADGAVSRQLDTLWAKSYSGARPLDPGSRERAASPPSGRAATIEPLDAPLDQMRNPARSGMVMSWQGSDKRRTACADPACTNADAISIVGWARGGETLVFQTRTFDMTRLHAWEIGTNAVRPVAETPGVLGSDDSGADGQCQLALTAAICIAASADEPPALVSIDLQSGRRTTLFDPNPDLGQGRLGTAETIMLRDGTGAFTVGRLILPRDWDGHTRLPLVITSYVCSGFLLGGSGRDVPEHVLAGLGYAAICVDLGYDTIRWPSGFRATPDTVNQAALGFFEDAVHVLDQRGIIDPGRVALTGFSGSATATTFAISHSNTFTAASVTTEGSLDPIVCYLTAHYRSCAEEAQRQGFAPPYDSRDGLLRNAPAWHVEAITTPLLMQLPEVEYASMMQLYGAMLDYRRAVEMYVFADAYHYKNQPKQRLAVYTRNIDWIGFWLRGLTSLDTGSSGQNARWSMMRERQCELFAAEGARANQPWYCRL